MNLLALDWVVIPAVSILVFIVSYLWSEPILEWLHVRSLGQREEVLRLLELMFVETDRRKVTLMMLSSSFGLGALFFIAFWPNLVPGIIFGGAVTIAMWSVPKLLIKSMWEKRASSFVDQMVDGMTLMANGMKAGLSVQQCMERVQENMPNPISQEFGLVLSQMRIGRGMGDALNELGMRIPRADVQMFVTSVNILQETGGNMAETFQTITYTVRERQKIEKKIEALTAQGVAQGVIISCVPFFLFIVFLIVDPAFVEPLYTTTLGYIALMTILILIAIGSLAIRKVVKIEV
ncbi:MAG TPA: type II secretion system F family protein [Bdellovibrionales bacterium]|nr:type II secretion system F family protein [Bdellovibrionales bacterium]